MIDVNTKRCIAGSRQGRPVLAGELVAVLYRIGVPVAPVQFVFKDRDGKGMLHHVLQYGLRVSDKRVSHKCDFFFFFNGKETQRENQ